jgi:hypothetical protein
MALFLDTECGPQHSPSTKWQPAKNVDLGTVESCHTSIFILQGP